MARTQAGWLLGHHVSASGRLEFVDQTRVVVVRANGFDGSQHRGSPLSGRLFSVDAYHGRILGGRFPVNQSSAEPNNRHISPEATTACLISSVFDYQKYPVFVCH